MPNFKQLVIFLCAFSISLIFIGCKKSASKVVIPNLGFSMRLPAGWQVDPKDNTNFYESTKQDDNFGWVAEYELEEDESLTEFVDSLIVDVKNMELEQIELLKSLGEEADETEYPETQLLAKNSRMVNGREAIELITEANYSILELYILKDNKVIQVTFRVLKDDFPKYEPILHKSIETIKIK